MLSIVLIFFYCAGFGGPSELEFVMMMRFLLEDGTGWCLAQLWQEDAVSIVYFYYCQGGQGDWRFFSQASKKVPLEKNLCIILPESPRNNGFAAI